MTSSYPLTRYLNSIKIINVGIISLMMTIAVIHSGLIYKALRDFDDLVRIPGAITGGLALSIAVFATTVNKDKLHLAFPYLFAFADCVGVITFLGPEEFESWYLGILLGTLIAAFAFLFQKKSLEAFQNEAYKVGWFKLARRFMKLRWSFNELKEKLTATELKLSETEARLAEYEGEFKCDQCDFIAKTVSGLKTHKWRKHKKKDKE